MKEAAFLIKPSPGGRSAARPLSHLPINRRRKETLHGRPPAGRGNTGRGDGAAYILRQSGAAAAGRVRRREEKRKQIGENNRVSELEWPSAKRGGHLGSDLTAPRRSAGPLQRQRKGILMRANSGFS